MSRASHALHGVAVGGSALLAMVLVAATGVWLLDVPVIGDLAAAMVRNGRWRCPRLVGGARRCGNHRVGTRCRLGLSTNWYRVPRGTRSRLVLGPVWNSVPFGTRSRLELGPRWDWVPGRPGALAHFHAGAAAAAVTSESACTVAVLALCWSAWRFEPVRRPVLAAGLALFAVSGLCLLGGLVAGLLQGRQQVAGWALLGAPNAACLAIPYGLGVPFVVDLPGQAGLPQIDGGGWLRPVTTAVSVVVVLAIGLLAARPVRAALAVGGTLLACTLLTLGLGRGGVGMFDALTLEVRGNPWLALLFGLAGGAVAGGVSARLGNHGKPARSR